MLNHTLLLPKQRLWTLRAEETAQRQNCALYRRAARLAQATWTFGLIYTTPEQVRTILIHNIAVSFLRDKTYWKISIKWISAHWHQHIYPLCQDKGQEIKDLALPDFHSHKFLYTGKFSIRQLPSDSLYCTKRSGYDLMKKC